ncbi:MAG: hypothetical protein ACK52I_31945, partial [Pseudomonadota bacterium]
MHGAASHPTRVPWADGRARYKHGCLPARHEFTMATVQRTRNALMAVPLENADRATAPPPADAAAAMNRVLATERATLAEVESERARCEARVAAARRAASARVDRAEAVARAIHART